MYPPLFYSDLPCYFGPYSRYKASAFKTRFGTVEYHVHDAEVPDPDGDGVLPSLIRQFDTFEELVAFAESVTEE